MKKILLAATAATVAISSPALAASTDTATLNVSGTVQNECSIAAPTAVNFSTVNINEGAGANALLLRNGSQAQTQNIYVSCNYTTSIKAESQNGGLLNAAGADVAANDQQDFTNKIHYRVKLTATDNSFPVLDFRTRLEASDSVTAGGAFHNNAALEVRIDRDDTAKRPVAGTYTDVTTITVGTV